MNNLSEEEKQAIDILNTFIFRQKTKNYNKLSLEDTESVKIVLNLIEKQNKVIDKMAEQYEKNAKFSPSIPYGATKEELIKHFYKEVEND